MAHQYDVFRLSGGTMVVVIQNDLLSEIKTRVVIPMLPEKLIGKPLQALNPAMDIDGDTLILMPQLMATVASSELDIPICSIAASRDSITRAIDTLLAGV